MQNKLGKEFFRRRAVEVSKNVLGKFLVRRLENGKILEGKIVEVEAYVGPHDRASHAFVPYHLRRHGVKKVTLRNHVEFLEGGHIYIYLVYGMYWQLNITTGPANYPECFLIRAIEIIGDKKAGSGPGKLCNYLKLDKNFYGENVAVSKRIWLEDRGVKVSKKEIIAKARVGIDYAGPYWAKRELRFFIKSSASVSKPRLLPKK